MDPDPAEGQRRWGPLPHSDPRVVGYAAADEKLDAWIEKALSLEAENANLRALRAAAVAQERERCAQLAKRYMHEDEFDLEHPAFAEGLLAAIREGT